MRLDIFSFRPLFIVQKIHFNAIHGLAKLSRVFSSKVYQLYILAHEILSDFIEWLTEI